MANTEKYYKIKHGLEAPTQDSIQVTESSRPTIRPSLSLDFANSKVLDPRITFARASTATYYDGKTVAKAEENLLVRSQEFDNGTWQKENSTVSSNVTIAPDGTSTAYEIITSLTTGRMGVIQTIFGAALGKEYVISVFAKANTASSLSFNDIYGSNYSVPTFNLSTGTATGTGASILNIGNGWYRCSLAFTCIKTFDRFTFYLRVNETGTAGDSLYLWGAQVEADRLTLTAYTSTTTQPITNYIPVLQTATNDIARFDHDPITNESLGLLIEEQRTNLVTYSQEFADASWGKLGSTIAANTVVAPDGTLTGDKLVEDTATSVHRVTQAPTILISTSYSFSVFAKAAERSILQLRDTASAVGVWFNLTSGTVGTSSAGITGSIISVGNGWYRCTAVRTTAALGIPWGIQVANADNINSYTGDGYSGIYIWGAQLEAGAFPTSYIKTEASQVTRSFDSASITGANFSSWYRADEGSLFVEHDWIVPTSTAAVNSRGPISINNSSNVIVNHNIYNASGNAVSRSADDAGVGQTFMGYSSGSPLTGLNKFSFAYKVNDYAFVATGQPVLIDTIATVPYSVNQLWIGRMSNSFAYSRIRKISYYPARLTNEQLQGLTSS